MYWFLEISLLFHKSTHQRLPFWPKRISGRRNLDHFKTGTKNWCSGNCCYGKRKSLFLLWMTVITISGLYLDAYNSKNAARTLTKFSGLKHKTIIKALAKTGAPEVVVIEKVSNCFCYEWPSWQYERYFHILITPELQLVFWRNFQNESSGPF